MKTRYNYMRKREEREKTGRHVLKQDSKTIDWGFTLDEHLR